MNIHLFTETLALTLYSWAYMWLLQNLAAESDCIECFTVSSVECGFVCCCQLVAWGAQYVWQSLAKVRTWKKCLALICSIHAVFCRGLRRCITMLLCCSLCLCSYTTVNHIGTVTEIYRFIVCRSVRHTIQLIFWLSCLSHCCSDCLEQSPSSCPLQYYSHNIP